jgi:asparagine synthase (glutamine-hydrolysing)
MADCQSPVENKYPTGDWQSAIGNRKIMSAIVGLLFFNQHPVTCEDVQTMLAHLQRRGPDVEDVWLGESIGLGHRSLRVGEKLKDDWQLFSGNVGSHTIVADVRLDNREELMEELNTETFFGDNPTDTELILSAYKRWKEDCPKKLLGDFAFAIWDSREQTLFCARDHFGVKPFYFTHTGQLFAFASSANAIVSLPCVSRRVNEARIADYLVPILEGVDKTSTFFQDIFRLAPAHILIARCGVGNVTSRKYWSLDYQKEIHLSSDDEYAASFREIFKEAVHARLRGNRVASMLSGGLDSSSVVCMARHILAQTEKDKRLITFSAVMEEDKECCESPFIKAVIEQDEGSGLDARFIRSGQLDQFGEDIDFFLNNAEDLFDFTDIPFFMYAAARKEGVRAMLDGVDGDCVASSNTAYLSDYARRGDWRAFFSELSGYSSYYQMSGKERIQETFAQGVKPAIKPLLPQNVTDAWRRFRGRDVDQDDSWMKDSLIDAEFARRVGLSQRLMTRAGDTQISLRSFRENDWLTLNAPFITAALERYERIAAIHSIEARHPFFDRRLVEFCLALPLKQKNHQGWTKMILRQAMNGIMPDKIRWRGFTPTNLNGHFFQRLLEFKKELIDELLLNEIKTVSPFLDVRRLKEIYAKLKTQTSIESCWTIWQAATLVIWLKRNRLNV